MEQLSQNKKTKRMSYRAWIYISSVLLVGVGLSVLTLPAGNFTTNQWLTFAVLTLFASYTQLFKAGTHNHQSYYATRVFQFAGLLLLHPSLFVLLIIIPHLVEWGKEWMINSPHLRTWYQQPFNIATHIIAGSTARWVYIALVEQLGPFNPLLPVISVTSAALVYVFTNHLLVGQVLVLVHTLSWRASGVLNREHLLGDLVLLCLGYIVTVLWQLNPWLLPLGLLPLALMYRALKVPQLKYEAQTDAKTGLWNTRHFNKLFAAELERAQRFDRPLAVIMADLDLLRNVNNTYGHLAGDAVLAGIGQIIRNTVREYDIAGRFGGEEFALLLPEIDPAEAQLLAERLRRAVAAAHFNIANSPTPINVTMSIGLACYPDDGITPTELVHRADVAVYQAKLQGRNRVVRAADVPHSVKLDHTSAMERMVAAPISWSTRIAAQDDINKPEHLSPDLLADAPASKTPMAKETMPAVTSTKPPLKLWLFVGSVIATGVCLATAGFVGSRQLDWGAIVLFALLALVAELLLVELYATGSVSVSVAIAFAAALVTGLPGVAVVSAAIAISVEIVFTRNSQTRIAPYKTAFNWSTHMIAGVAPVLVIKALNVPVHVATLPVLMLPAAAAALAYYAIETGLVAGAISLSKGQPFLKTWREQFGWLTNHYLVLCALGLFLATAYTGLGVLGVLVFTLPVLMMRSVQKQYVERTEDSVRELKRMNDELTRANSEVLEASTAIQQLNDELFLTLSKIIDARDPYVGGHAAKVADYATAIALELGLSAERVEQVRQAGFLHDIGKIAISEQILHKPDRLTDEEYEIIKTHATIGADFLETSQSLRHLAPFVRHHHERWDGRGYPDGLRGTRIPLEARILAVCDSVEAMASDRPYHKGLALSDVIAEVKRCASTQFDPLVVEVFVLLAEKQGAALIVNSAHEVEQKQVSSIASTHLTFSALSTG